MWLISGHFIFARGEINRLESMFSIDAGLAGGGLVAPKSTVEAAGIVLDDKKTGVGQGGGGAVRFVPFRADARLGALTRRDVPGVYMSDGDPYGMFRFKVGNVEKQEVGRRANNRVENSHQPFRPRERAMLRFRRMKTLQKFTAVHAAFHNHFNKDRHLTQRDSFKDQRPAALAEWESLIA